MARRQGHGAVLPMLLASGLLWGAAWALWHTLPPVAAPAPQRAEAQPLPVRTFGQPALAIALAELPRPKKSARQTQRLRSDLLALFGHVAGELVRDELDTMVLRLSLGQQVAVRLRQGVLE